jgi:hypothetical protein
MGDRFETPSQGLCLDRRLPEPFKTLLLAPAISSPNSVMVLKVPYLRFGTDHTDQDSGPLVHKVCFGWTRISATKWLRSGPNSSRTNSARSASFRMCRSMSCGFQVWQNSGSNRNSSSHKTLSAWPSDDYTCNPPLRNPRIRNRVAPRRAGRKWRHNGSTYVRSPRLTFSVTGAVKRVRSVCKV